MPDLGLSSGYAAKAASDTMRSLLAEKFKDALLSRQQADAERRTQLSQDEMNQRAEEIALARGDREKAATAAQQNAEADDAANLYRELPAGADITDLAKTWNASQNPRVQNVGKAAEKKVTASGETRMGGGASGMFGAPSFMLPTGIQEKYFKGVPQKTPTATKTYAEVPQGVDVPGSDKPVPAVFDRQDAVYRDMTPEHNVIPGARAHKEPYQGIPVVAMQGPEGPGAFNKQTNTFTPAINAQTGEQVGRPISPTMADKASGIEQSLSIIQKLIATPKDNIIGPLQGRAREVGTMVPGYETPQDVADFIADSNTLQNNVIKAITGAQMSEVEAKRIKGQIPLVTDQATVWNAKAKATIDNLQLIHDRMLALAGAPKNLSQPPAQHASVPKEVSDVFASVPKGQSGSIEWQGKTYRIDAQGNVTVK